MNNVEIVKIEKLITTLKTLRGYEHQKLLYELKNKLKILKEG